METAFLNTTKYFLRAMKRDSPTQNLEVVTENLTELTSGIPALVVNTNKVTKEGRSSIVHLVLNNTDFTMSSKVPQVCGILF